MVVWLLLLDQCETDCATVFLGSWCNPPITISCSGTCCLALDQSAIHDTAYTLHVCQLDISYTIVSVTTVPLFHAHAFAAVNRNVNKLYCMT